MGSFCKMCWVHVWIPSGWRLRTPLDAGVAGANDTLPASAAGLMRRVRSSPKQNIGYLKHPITNLGSCRYGARLDSTSAAGSSVYWTATLAPDYSRHLGQIFLRIYLPLSIFTVPVFTSIIYWIGMEVYYPNVIPLRMANVIYIHHSEGVWTHIISSWLYTVGTANAA